MKYKTFNLIGGDYKKNIADIESMLKEELDYCFIIIDKDIERIINFDKSKLCKILKSKEDNKYTYFLSLRYSTISNLLFKIEKVINSSRKSSVFIGKDFVIKYSEKEGNSFYDETCDEVKFIEELNEKEYKIFKQEIYYKEKNDLFVSYMNRRVDGVELDKKILKTLSIEEKISFLKQLTLQYSIFEEKGYAYDDLRLDNIIYNKKNNEFILIDLGSIVKLKKIERYYYLRSYRTPSILDNYLLMFYNVFNIESNNIFYLRSSKFMREVRSTNNYKYFIKVLFDRIRKICYDDEMQKFKRIHKIILKFEKEYKYKNLSDLENIFRNLH